MRNCLECKWCELYFGDCEPYDQQAGSASCAKSHWEVPADFDERRHHKSELARAIKTAETCPDFEGESDGE